MRLNIAKVIGSLHMVLRAVSHRHSLNGYRLTSGARSSVYADAQSELTVGSVADLEDGHLAQQVERHVADLDNMAALVRPR